MGRRGGEFWWWTDEVSPRKCVCGPQETSFKHPRNNEISAFENIFSHWIYLTMKGVNHLSFSSRTHDTYILYKRRESEHVNAC